MGFGELGFDSPAIDRAGGRIQLSANDLKAKVDAFNTELQSYGQPWGSDDVGMLIGMCYQAIYEIAMECFQENIAELSEYGNSVRVMAATYRESEDLSAIEVNRVRDILG
ncbi:WXG100 family type VII secretion target [Thermomonospora cellulosilytica]|uniref:PE domain-containing protein n=1 Tax=Thermomonospora cellulosilytica TaxID=1411118 RepID=A0A7W3RBX3_9ACTN|nr:hypothetical protein [Thermomonospora cellulosilytica]MBA9007244.1 hypothetical protein [Thermomonospora cellulosilytica]